MDHNLTLIKALVNTLQVEVETLDDRSADIETEQVDLAEKVKQYEAKLIKAALLRTGGNQRKAAHILTLKTSTLNAKIKQLGISFFRSTPEAEAAAAA